MTVCLRQAVFVPPSVCVVADELGIHADGGDLRIVAQVESTTPLQLVARPSVTGVQGLRGAVLGVDAVNHGFPVVWRHLLARDRWEALRAGSIEATLLGPSLDEQATGDGFVSPASVEAEVPDFPGQGVVAGPGMLKAHGDGLLRIWRRWKPHGSGTAMRRTSK